MRRLARRIRDIPGSATMKVDQRAKELAASGQRVILLNSGEADYAVSPNVIQAAADSCTKPTSHRYSATPGQIDLRQALSGMYREGGRELGPDQIVVTNGTKHAIFVGLNALVDPGDEVLLPVPFWTSFPEAIRLAGGIPVYVDPDPGDAFDLDIDQLDARATPKTRLLILASPGNPTGKVYSEHTLAAIGQWAKRRGIWIMFDEIYRELIYDDAYQGSILTACPDIADQCVIVGGVGKAFCMAGWRVGWIVGPSDIVDGIARFQSHSTSHVANVPQAAALAALNARNEFLPGLRAEMMERRTVMQQGLETMEGVSFAIPSGGFYFFVNFNGFMGGRHQDTGLLADQLLRDCHVAVVPGEAFGLPGYLRLSFTPDIPSIAEGIGRIREFATS